MINQIKNPTFGGFKPDAMQRIAGTLGYTGDMSGFQQYLDQNPDKRTQMDQFKQAATMMAKGGAVRKYQQGGMGVPEEQTQQQQPQTSQQPNMLQLDPNVTTPQITEPLESTQPQQPTQPITDIGQPVPLPIEQPIIPPDPTFPVQPPVKQPTPEPETPAYDPSQGMPDESTYLEQQDSTIEEVFQDPNWNEGTTGVNMNLEADKNWAKSTVKEYATNAAIKENPDGYELVKKGKYYSIVYPDGTEIGTRHRNINYAKGRANALSASFKAAAPVSANYESQQEAYRKYVTEQTTGGVTGDIENIEQEYTNAQTAYTQQNLELQRLQEQSDANPDDPYLKELVEAKGKEVSDTYGRLQQLQPLYQSTQKTIKDVMTERATDPTLPEGATVEAQRIQQQPGQFIEAGSGQVSGEFGVSEVALADTYLSANVEQPDTAKYEADVSAEKVAAQTESLEAAQTDEDDPRAKVTAAMTTASMVGDLNAAQGTATLMENDVQREIQNGELVSGAAADATKAAKFTEQIDAATATPSEKATVQGQLVGLMEQFESGEPPAWAAGAMRLANQQMSARGLGASSMAGQAIVQAAMESALPIAQADAATVAQFEAQNLSNRQQRAMLAAEQRATFMGQEFDQEFQTRVLNASKISDIANMNFTADQQVQLENARMVNTMNLENLSNRQAMVLAEASALANLDIGNLNNRQQASVQNAQNFLQMDMANLSNQQQTEIFKSQQIINSMLTDQAAVNASRQFNAQSENQANQFYDNLNSTINMHNSEQQNAQERFNAGQVNAASQFNAEMKNNREQFNAQNQLVVDQSNATWRREIATADTAATNRANELNAINTLDISNTAYNNMWQLYGDQMEWAWTSAENQQDRLSELAQEQLSLEERKMMIDADSSKSFGSLVSSLLFTDMSTLSKTFAGSFLGG